MALGFPAYHQLRKKHGLTKAQCEAKAAAALAALPWIEIAYLKNAAFDFRTQGSMMTFAERVVIYIGETEILVKSSCLFPAQFLDFGKNESNVNLFFETYQKVSADD